MEIVHIAAELAPVIKVGGLGDVLFGLAESSAAKQQEISVFLPKYNIIDFELIEDLEVIHHDFRSFFDEKWHHNTIWKGRVKNFSLYLFETHDPQGFFERDCVYGAPDDTDRFLYFCRLCLEFLHSRQKLPDILHLHDWHAAGAALLQKELFQNAPKILLTLHNLAYQGGAHTSSLRKVGIKRPFENEWINLLQEGITYADCVNTVSPTYASEILTPEFGFGLQEHLKKNAHKLTGILNGIDNHFWDPKHDKWITHHYSDRDLTEKPPFIENKAKEKKLLHTIFSIEENHAPLIGCVTRLVPQKSPELIKQALLWTVENKGRFILIGQPSDQKTHDEFYNLKRELADTKFVHIELNYNEKLAHHVFAGSDLIIVPSLFEPCGLTQLIAMRYGALPLVRHTGGLADTVTDGENGFSFLSHSKEGIEEALQRAFTTWRNAPDSWARMMKQAMTADHSWHKPAEEYLALYNALFKN